MHEREAAARGASSPGAGPPPLGAGPPSMTCPKVSFLVKMAVFLEKTLKWLKIRAPGASRACSMEGNCTPLTVNAGPGPHDSPTEQKKD